MGVAISPDEKYVAAYERESNPQGKPQTGDLVIWDAAGKLLHRLPAALLKEKGGAGPVFGTMRFTPDSRHLAAESGGRIFVIEVETGTIIAALSSGFDRWLQFSPDGATLTAITPVAGSDGGREPAARV